MRPSQSAATICCDVRTLLAWIALATLSGCAMYNHPYPATPITDGLFDFHVIQSDDEGSFWDRDAAQRVLDRVQQLSATKNTLVVLFIHGWHHNGESSDPNLVDFRLALDELNTELTNEGRNKLRERATGARDFRIVGIYVGWRGKSLPMPLDYLTFWGRKPTAERVGNGDTSEFIERLQRIYLRANASGREGSQKPFTGLITIGHSFGGQVLWKSLARQLEFPLAERAPYMSNSLDPAAKNQATVQVPIDSLGDLNILVNPALEAYQFARVDALHRQLGYPSTQTPQVVVFSADNDTARSIWFPLARGVTWPFRPTLRPDNDGYQGALYGRALGEVETQLTHELVRSPGIPDSLSEASYASQETLLKYDFTGPTYFGGIGLLPKQQGGHKEPGRIPYSPLLVVQSRDKIIDGHNGIFGEEFRGFLRKYVAFIEGKRLLIRAVRKYCGPDEKGCSAAP